MRKGVWTVMGLLEHEPTWPILLLHTQVIPLPNANFSQVYNGFSIQSTPRDEEEAMRSTPGVLFQGHQRPSTVRGQVADNKEVMSLVPGC